MTERVRSPVRSPLRGSANFARGSRQHAAPDAPDDTAEVVVLGEILGATGFSDTCKGSVFCKWAVVHGEHWTLAAGDKSGATQASVPSSHGGALAAWSHPIQLSFKTSSVQVRCLLLLRTSRKKKQKTILHSSSSRLKKSTEGVGPAPNGQQFFDFLIFEILEE